MPLYEIWYHDKWRTYDTYERQYIKSSEENTKQ